MTRLPSPRSSSSARASQVGVAAAFLAVALVFVAFLVVGLIVAAIMGLATIMPAWLAALLVCGVFLVIAAIAGLVGVGKFKKAMPLVPEDTIRGIKYDLGIAKEGSAFDPAVLDPESEQSTRPPRPPRRRPPPRPRLRRKPRRPPSRTSVRRPPKRNCDAGWTSAARTSPASAMNSTRNSTSRPRPRPCWPRPR